jgi:hypothetical protein
MTAATRDSLLLTPSIEWTITMVGALFVVTTSLNANAVSKPGPQRRSISLALTGACRADRSDLHLNPCSVALGFDMPCAHISNPHRALSQSFLKMHRLQRLIWNETG